MHRRRPKRQEVRKEARSLLDDCWFVWEEEEEEEDFGSGLVKEPDSDQGGCTKPLNLDLGKILKEKKLSGLTRGSNSKREKKKRPDEKRRQELSPLERMPLAPNVSSNTVLVRCKSEGSAFVSFGLERKKVDNSTAEYRDDWDITPTWANANGPKAERTFACLATGALHAVLSTRGKRGMLPCRLGREPRGSFLVTSSQTKSAVVVLVAASTGVFVAPIIGGGGPAGAAWAAAKNVEEQILATLKEPLDTLPFAQVCSVITAQRERWEIALTEACAEPEATSDRVTAFKASSFIRKYTQSLGLSVGGPIDPYDLFCCWLDKQFVEPAGQQPGPRKETSAGCFVVTPETCLICFERLEDDAPLSTFVKCGHRVCSDCWKDYFLSAARAGETAGLCCPVPSCEERTNLLDAAHVLFVGNDSGTSPDAVFRRLVQNELNAICVSANCRHCPNALCGRMLQQSTQPHTTLPGWNLLYCSCSVSLCADCDVGRAHPGMTCSSYKALREAIDSGRADAEYANYEWLMEHSRPCPRCSFPINKDGGCNHVRCSKCNFYFCWQCGGEGHLCMAYHCKNRNRYWHERDEYDASSYDDLRSRVSSYQDFRGAEVRLRNLEKLANTAAGDSSLFQFEIEIQLVVVWIRGLMATTNENCESLRRLELVLHAGSLRSLMNGLMRKKPLLYIQEAFAQVVGVPPPRRKRHKKGHVGDDSGGNSGDYDAMIADLELEELCLADDRRFRRQVRNAVQDGIRFLSRTTADTRTNRRRRQRKKGHEPAMESAPLNERKPAKESWKNNLTGEEDTDKPVEILKWKGKTKAKARLRC